MPFSEMVGSGPPRPDQIEVTVFGPSYGECVVAHLGGGNWIVIDSCSYEATKLPIALSYLDALGLRPAATIRAVISTHWHDDHCRGLSQILVAAPDAHIWIASALTNLEFLRFKARMEANKTVAAGSKLSEFSSVINEIRRRNDASLVTFGFASARTSVYRLPANRSSHGFDCEVLAVSPSYGDVLNFWTWIAANMPQARQSKRAIPSPQPNDVSVVAMISAGPVGVLLGADLEDHGDGVTGWKAIITRHTASPLSPRATVFKIPHHGSEGAYNADVWHQLLSAEPVAVLTPWRKGRGRLPTTAGIDLRAPRTMPVRGVMATKAGR